MKHVTSRSLGVLLIAVATTGFAVACDDTPTSPSSASSVTITGSAPAVGATSQLTATAVLTDGTTADVTTSATWQSANDATATVSSTGLVTGITSGTVEVQATYLEVTGSIALTIP